MCSTLAPPHLSFYVGSSHCTKSAKWTRGESIQRPYYIGFALKIIQLARCAHCGSTEDVDSLASSGVSTSLALEIKTGAPPIPAELRRLIREMSRDNSLWGEQRIANELLHLSAQSRSGHRRLRFLCGGHGELSRSIHLCDHRARVTPSSPLECDVESDASLDVAAVARGDRL